MSKHTEPGAFPEKMAHLYETPEHIAATVIRRLRLNGLFWEPFAGNGNICRALLAEGHETLAYDIINYSGYDHDRIVDFFELVKFPKFDHIITNPPYGKRNSLIIDIIHRLLAKRPIHGVIALLLPADYDCGSTRREVFADNPHYRGQIKVMDRIVWIPGTKNGGTLNYIWHVWGPTSFDWTVGRRAPIVDYMRGKENA